MFNEPLRVFPQYPVGCILLLCVLLSTAVLLRINITLWKKRIPRRWIVLLCVFTSPYCLYNLLWPEAATAALDSIAWSLVWSLLVLAGTGLEFFALLRFKSKIHPLLYRICMAAASLAVVVHGSTTLLWLRQLILGEDKVFNHAILAYITRIGTPLLLANIVLWIMIIHWFAMAPRAVLFRTEPPVGPPNHGADDA